MQDYPSFPISTEGYSPEWSDGTEAMRAESGRDWLYRSYDVEHVTLTITHPALDRDQEAALRAFYRDHKSEHVRFFDPRTEEYYIVQMQGPPRLSGMRSGLLADLEMTLLGVRE